MTVKQLKDELGKLKLPKSGNKKVLIELLTNALQEMIARPQQKNEPVLQFV